VSACGASSSVSVMEWHPFSLASAPMADNDILEFHITVMGKATEIQDGATLRVKTVPGELLLRRARNPLDWICPYRVPHMKTAASTRSWSPMRWIWPDRAAGRSVAPLPSGSCRVKPSGALIELTDAKGTRTKAGKPQEQWTGKLWNLVRAMQDAGDASDHVVRIMGPYGTLHSTCFSHSAVMLIGAGVGYPSMGSLLRQILEENLTADYVATAAAKRHVCFIWTCSKVDQLLLCFPSLLADLTRYVHRSSLARLQDWLTVKIFVGSLGPDDVLAVEPDGNVGLQMPGALSEVKKWLLGQAVKDGTYITRGSLGASFSDILRRSLFMREKVVNEGRSLGICFCGPLGLCTWLKNDIECTSLPCAYEFACEVAGS